MNLSHVTSGPVATFMSTLNSNFDAIGADGAINSDNLNTGAVTTTKISDGAVTESKIGNGAVTTTKISNGSVTTAKMTFPTVPSNTQAYNEDVQTWSKFIGNLSYPVGSYYWSSSQTNPANIFGGTWEQIKDRFVLAVGNTYTSVGATSGSSTATLTRSNLPTNMGKFEAYVYNTGGPEGIFTTVTAAPYVYDTGTVISGANGIKYTKIRLSNPGGGQPHENMPPYVTAYCWRRTELADLSND